MLWIEYEATHHIEPQQVKDVTIAIGKLISPFLVAVYDESEFGHGLICHKEILPEGEAHDSSNADSAAEWDRPVEPSLSFADDEVDHKPVSQSTPALTAVIPEAAHETGPIQETSTPDIDCGSQFALATTAIETSEIQEEDSDDHIRESDENTPQQDQSQDNDGGYQDSNRNNPPPDNATNQPQGRNQQGGNNNEPERSGNRDDQSNVSLVMPQPDSEPELCKITFRGDCGISFVDDYHLNLHLAFRLLIEPKEYGRGRPVDCRINLVNVSVRVAEMQYTGSSDTPPKLPERVFVIEEACIIIGPSNGEHLELLETKPIIQDFYNHLSNDLKYGYSIRCGFPPQISINASIERTNTTERSLATLKVEPKYLGPAGTAAQDCQWQYGVKKMCKTAVVLGTTNPPAHEATYRLEADGPSPDDMRVILKVIFKQQQKLTQSKRHPFTHLAYRHLELELEAKISEDDNDHFRFPTSNKAGCCLSMGLKVDKGKIWPGNTDEKDLGVVKSKFQSRTIKR